MRGRTRYKELQEMQTIMNSKHYIRKLDVHIMVITPERKIVFFLFLYKYTTKQAIVQTYYMSCKQCEQYISSSDLSNTINAVCCCMCFVRIERLIF